VISDLWKYNPVKYKPKRLVLLLLVVVVAAAAAAVVILSEECVFTIFTILCTLPLLKICSLCGPCGLRGCKNRPAPFPGWMSYNATKLGLVSFYILTCFNCTPFNCIRCLLWPLFMYC